MQSSAMPNELAGLKAHFQTGIVRLTVSSLNGIKALRCISSADLVVIDAWPVWSRVGPAQRIDLSI